MGLVGGDQNMVTRPKIALAFALDAETRRTGEQEDPFVMSLTIRSIRRGQLTGRDNALDPHALSQKHFRENLAVCMSRQVIEKIHHAPRLRSGDPRKTSGPTLSSRSIRKLCVATP